MLPAHWLLISTKQHTHVHGLNQGGGGGGMGAYVTVHGPFPARPCLRDHFLHLTAITPIYVSHRYIALTRIILFRVPKTPTSNYPIIDIVLSLSLLL